ncbi:hypothetical protein [Nocardia brasiliensis]|uniref:hypothetical protein n=1 Tax=Nocardia brasiliensis TaxID=37326 RepID=UPI002458B3E9|nr:hypothetical protein [Nocardia brasiliensis]
MVAHHPTAPKDLSPEHPPWPRWHAEGEAPEPVTALGTLAAFRRAVEQRLHWAAEAAVINALADQAAPWGVIQQAAQAGLVPITAAAGVCLGWKLVFVRLPRLGRWIAERGLLHFEVRFSIGNLRGGATAAPAAAAAHDSAATHVQR